MKGQQSGNKKGRGLAIFANSKWCNPGHVTVKESTSTLDIEPLAVGPRPYLHLEFFHIMGAGVVCIPLSMISAQASDVIHSTVTGLQRQHSSASITINEDFNHASLSKSQHEGGMQLREARPVHSPFQIRNLLMYQVH